MAGFGVEENGQHVPVGARPSGQFRGQLPGGLVHGQHRAVRVHEGQGVRDAFDNGLEHAHLPQQAVDGREVLRGRAELPAQGQQNPPVMAGGLGLGLPGKAEDALGVAGTRLDGHEDPRPGLDAGAACQHVHEILGHFRTPVGLGPGVIVLRGHGADVGDAFGPESPADLGQGEIPELGPRAALAHVFEKAHEELDVGLPRLRLPGQRVSAFVDHFPKVLGIVLKLPAGLEEMLAHLLHAFDKFLDLVALFEPAQEGCPFGIGHVAPEHATQPLEIVDHEHPKQDVGRGEEEQRAQGEKSEVRQDGLLHPPHAAVHGNAHEIHAGDGSELFAETPVAVKRDEFGRGILGMSVAVHAPLVEADGAGLDVVFLPPDGLVALPHLLVGVDPEITDQVPLVLVGLIGGVAGVDGHAAVDGAVTVVVDRGHDRPGNEGRGHGLDDEGRRQPLVHRRPQHVADVVLDGIHMGEDEQGLVPHLLLQDVLHVQVEARGKGDAQNDGRHEEAGNEFGLDLRGLGDMHGLSWDEAVSASRGRTSGKRREGPAAGRPVYIRRPGKPIRTEGPLLSSLQPRPPAPSGLHAYFSSRAKRRYSSPSFTCSTSV